MTAAAYRDLTGAVWVAYLHALKPHGDDPRAAQTRLREWVECLRAADCPAGGDAETAKNVLTLAETRLRAG